MRIAGVAAILTGGFAMTACGLPGGGTNCSRFRFDSTTWKRVTPDEAAYSEEKVRVRQQLADKLIECRTLIGKSRAMVRELLGPPYRTQRYHISYLTGPERRLLSTGPEFLLILFDRRGIVIEVSDTFKHVSNRPYWQRPQP